MLSVPTLAHPPRAVGPITQAVTVSKILIALQMPVISLHPQPLALRTAVEQLAWQKHAPAQRLQSVPLAIVALATIASHPAAHIRQADSIVTGATVKIYRNASQEFALQAPA